MTRVLITGAAGFIGHHVVDHFLATTDWELVLLDGLTYAGDPSRLGAVRGWPEPLRSGRVKIVWHDLRSPIVGHPAQWQIGDVDYVVNLAAASHVDRSIEHPVPFVRGNLDIALNVLEWCRAAGPSKVVQVSTDEVYGPAYGEAHDEDATINPSNPYSASKAAQEAVAASWWRTYGVPVVITRCMNNFGERQDPEKFVPLAVSRLLAGRPVPVHGRRLGGGWQASSRAWLHARNHADAIRFLLAEIPFPAYDPAAGSEHLLRVNVPGDRELGADEIVAFAAEVLGVPPLIEWVDWHSSRPGHDMRYALDGTRLHRLGWKPPIEFGQAFADTVRWYADHREWLAR